MSDLLARLEAALAGRYPFDREADGGASRLGQGGLATAYLTQELRHRRGVDGWVYLPDARSGRDGEGPRASRSGAGTALPAGGLNARDSAGRAFAKGRGDTVVRACRRALLSGAERSGMLFAMRFPFFRRLRGEPPLVELRQQLLSATRAKQ